MLSVASISSKLSRRLLRATLRPVAAASYSNGAGDGDKEASKKLYELRTYAIRPDKFGEYMKI